MASARKIELFRKAKYKKQANACFIFQSCLIRYGLFPPGFPPSCAGGSP